MLSVTGFLELDPADDTPSAVACLQCAVTLKKWWSKSTCRQTVEPDGRLRITFLWASMSADDRGALRGDLDEWAAGSPDARTLSSLIDVVDVVAKTGETWSTTADGDHVGVAPADPLTVRAHVQRWRAELEDAVSSMSAQRCEPDRQFTELGRVAPLRQETSKQAATSIRAEACAVDEFTAASPAF